MKPEDMSVVLRSREMPEAADLGVRLVQEHARLVYVPWLILTVPFALGCLVASWSYPVGAGLFFWYFVIVFERAVLFSLSRAVFQIAPSARETLRAFFRTERVGLVWQLSVLRLSPRRSTTQPILQLEHARLSEYFRRAHFLCGGRNTPLIITLVYATVESLFALSLAFAVAVLIPQYQIDYREWVGYFDPSPWIGVVSNALYFISVIFLRPFYVASGFGIYLSQRTRIDGWDIELGVKSLAARITRSLKKPLASVAAFLAMVACTAAFGFAQSDADGGPVATIHRIKESPDFHTWIESTNYFEGRESTFGTNGIGGLGPMVKLFVVMSVAIVLSILVYFVIKYWRSTRPQSVPQVEPAWTAHALPPAHGQLLPKDPGATALELVRAGKYREALSLCLRASIAHFDDLIARPIPSGATETECLRMISGQVPRSGEIYFRRLARLWQQLAYARDSIQHVDVEVIASELGGVLQTTRDPQGPSSDQ